MPHCMVSNCSNGWRKTKGTNITYRRVPSNHMNDVWLIRMLTLKGNELLLYPNNASREGPVVFCALRMVY